MSAKGEPAEIVLVDDVRIAAPVARAVPTASQGVQNRLALQTRSGASQRQWYYVDRCATLAYADYARIDDQSRIALRHTPEITRFGNAGPRVPQFDIGSCMRWSCRDGVWTDLRCKFALRQARQSW